VPCCSPLQVSCGAPIVEGLPSIFLLVGNNDVTCVEILTLCLRSLFPRKCERAPPMSLFPNAHFSPLCGLHTQHFCGMVPPGFLIGYDFSSFFLLTSLQSKADLFRSPPILSLSSEISGRARRLNCCPESSPLSSMGTLSQITLLQEVEDQPNPLVRRFLQLDVFFHGRNCPPFFPEVTVCLAPIQCTIVSASSTATLQHDSAFFFPISMVWKMEASRRISPPSPVCFVTTRGETPPSGQSKAIRRRFLDP